MARAVVAGVVAAMAGCGLAVAQDSPYPAGDRFLHRVTVRGDEATAACAVRLEVDIPRGFHLAASSPLIAVTRDVTGERGAATLGALAAGAVATWDLELEAPASAASGSLCVRVVYDDCKGGGRAVLAASECRELTVVDGAALPAPTLRVVARPVRQCSDPNAAMQVWLDSTTSTYPLGWTPITWTWSIPAGHTLVGNGPLVLWLIPAGTWGPAITAGVVVTASNGERASGGVTITLDPPPVIDIVATPPRQCRDWNYPMTVNLNATATNFPSGATPVSWTWTVPAGHAIAGSGPMVDWTVPAGTSNLVAARLVVVDSNGCSSEFVESVMIDPGPWLDPLPAIVTCNDREAPFTVELDASAATPLSDIVSITWSTTDPDATITPTTFGRALLGLPEDWSGTVPVTVAILDSYNCVLTRSGTVLVHPSPDPSFVATVAPAGAASGFVANATGGAGALAHVWDFGDGGTAIGANVSHVYPSPGIYVVTLTVTDGNACESLAAQTLEVRSSLSAGLAVAPVCLGEATTLVATVTGGNPAFGYTWAFGDGGGTTTATASTSHTYSAPGSYGAAVSVRDADGTLATATTTAVVAPRPTLAVQRSGDGLTGTPQRFQTTSSLPLARAEWRFDDGVVLNGADVSRTFAAAGAGVATVYVEAALGGCTATASIPYTIAGGTTSATMSKSVSVPDARPGDVVEYTLIVTNGDGPLDDIRIEDSLPDAVTYVPFTMTRDGVAMPEPVAGFVMALASFPLAAGETTRIRYRAEVRADAPSGDYVNRASLRGRDASGGVVYAGPKTARLRVTAPEVTVDLRIRKSADPDPNPPVAGGIVHYRIDYENAGDATATNVFVRDDFPERFASVEENGDAGVVLGGRIEWRLRPVVPGGSGRLQYSLRLRSDLSSGTAITNLVVITGSEPDWDPSDNTDTSVVAVGGLPNLALTKAVTTAPDPAAAGAIASYELNWANHGSGSAPSAVIVDDYDESKLEIVTPPVGGTDTGGVLRIDLGDVAAGQTGVVRYSARVREGVSAEVVNTARISSALTDEDASDDSAEARFDIVLNPGTLRVASGLERMRRCLEPQIEAVLRSDHYDAGLAMLAAVELVDAAARLDQHAASARILEGGMERALAARLRSISRANVEALFLHSGMGLKATIDAGPSLEDGLAVYVPYMDAHPLYRGENGELNETWCAHEEHRRTSLAAVGYGLAAMATRIGLASGDDREAAAMSAIADLTLTWLERTLVTEPWTLATCMPVASGAVAELPVEAPGLVDRAAVVRGLARVAGLKNADIAARAATMLPSGIAALARELTAASVHPAAPAALAAAASAWRDAAEAGHDSAALEGALRSAWLELRPTLAPPAGLDSSLAAMRIELRLGDATSAIARWEELERTGVDPRLRVFRSHGPAAAVSYTPETLALLVGVGSELAHHSSSQDLTPIPTRLDAVVTTVAIEGRMQAGSRVFPGVAAPRILLGEGGALKLTNESGLSFAPVLLDRVSFAAGDARFRDLSMVEVVRGLGAGGAGSIVLTGGQDCSVSRARVIDRGFVTESGLFAIGEIDLAGAAVRDFARPLNLWMLADEGDRLRDLANRDALSLTLHSGLGVRLREAEAGLDEAALLTRLANAAGLPAVPPGLIPIWLPFGAGDPIFPWPVNASSRYAVGYDLTRVDRDVSGAALGEALLTRVRSIRNALREGDARSRFVALVETAAALPLARDLEKGSEGRRLVMDSAGQVVENGRLRTSPRLVDRAAVVEGQCALKTLLRDPALTTLAASAGLELGAERVAAAASRGFAELLTALGGATLGGLGSGDDPWASLLLTRALLAGAEEHPDRAAEARALAARIATALRSRGAEAEPAVVDGISPLSARALTLSTLALADPDDEAVRVAYGALADGFDPVLGLFPSGVVEPGGALGDAGFLLTDRDVGATIGALSRALPRLLLSERERAIAMIRSMTRRVLFEAGLQREHELPIQIAHGVLNATAAQLSRAVAIASSPPPPGRDALLPGDMLELSLVVSNPTPASSLVDAGLVVVLPEGIEHLPGSARVGGKPVAAEGGRELRIAIGRLGGEQTVPIAIHLRVATSATAGPRAVRVLARALDRPGAMGQPIEAAAGEHALAVEGFGAIEGLVWVDRDGDGVAGAEEARVRAATLVLDDGTSVVTAEDGTYRFETLVPATYETRLIDSTLPGSLRSAKGSRRVEVLPVDAARADFAVRALADVTGIVYRDEDGDGRWRRGEPRIPRVVVTAGSARAISDDSGRYLIRGVDTGSYELRVDRRQPFVEDDSDLRLWPLALEPEPN